VRADTRACNCKDGTRQAHDLPPISHKRQTHEQITTIQRSRRRRTVGPLCQHVCANPRGHKRGVDCSSPSSMLMHMHVHPTASASGILAWHARRWACACEARMRISAIGAGGSRGGWRVESSMRARVGWHGVSTREVGGAERHLRLPIHIRGVFSRRLRCVKRPAEPL
jgi:hypothetical protein